MLVVLGGIMVMSGRKVTQEQQARAGVNSIRQIIWQGATAAASRGQNLLLVRTNNVLEIKVESSPTTVVRKATLPSNFSTTLPQGNLYKFLPPGRLNFNSVSSTFTAKLGGRNYSFTVSQIGEVQVQ
jgi:hypothetical protein